MSGPILLDTCAAIWTANADPLRGEAEAWLAEAEGLAVSPITAWEIATLVSRGRLALTMDAKRWFAALLDAGVTLAPMPPEVLIDSATLAGAAMLRDPADRIIAATARAYGYRLMTRDRLLLDYGEAGHLVALPC